MPENTAKRARQAPALTPENTALLERYAAHLARTPLLGATPRTYLASVRGYLAWLQDAQTDGDPLADARAKDWAVRDYRTFMVTVAKNSVATVNKNLAAAASFYVWLGLGKPEGVKRHRPPKRAPKAMEPRAKLRYLRAVEACPSARNRAIALLPLYAGLRVAEIAALDVDDVRMSARKGELRIVGKGEKARTVPVNATLREALAEWLAERGNWPGASTTPALLLSGRGRRISTDSIADAIAGITAAAALDDHVTVHTCRHTFGTELTRGGVDLVTVADLMGHTSTETTRLYTRPSEADLQRAVDRLSADD